VHPHFLKEKNNTFYTHLLAYPLVYSTPKGSGTYITSMLVTCRGDPPTLVLGMPMGTTHAGMKIIFQKR